MDATLKDLYMEAFLRMRNQGILTWTTRTGKVIPIKDMMDEHLANTIRMLVRMEEERDDPFGLGNEGPGPGEGLNEDSM